MVNMATYIRTLRQYDTPVGVPTLKAFLQDGRELYLHSKYDPLQEATAWVDQQKVQENTIYIVLGFGRGYHVKELLERIPHNSYVFVIEIGLANPTYSIAINQWRVEEEWLQEKTRLHVHASAEVFVLAGMLNKFMQQVNINQLKICRYQPSMQLSEKFYNKLIKELPAQAEKLNQADFGFSLSAGQKVFSNAWGNLNRIFASHGIKKFAGAFKGKPAIVVSAGPSLNKNIQLIKQYQKAAVIIASGTAIGALRYHGIVPHFLVIIDPFDDNTEALKDFLHEDTILIAPYDAPAELIKMYPGEICFYHKPIRTGNEHVLSGIEQHLPPTQSLLAHISVAISAFAFAEHIGAEPIILTGQDLSFPASSFEMEGGKGYAGKHATGVKAGLYDLSGSLEKYPLVAGYYGDKVRTSKEFMMVLDLFAVMCKARQGHKTIINATEGGVFIAGAVHQSFQVTAEQYLLTDLNIDCLLATLLAPVIHSTDDLVAELRKLSIKNRGLRQRIRNLKKKFSINETNFKIENEDIENYFTQIELFLEHVTKHEIYSLIKSYFATLMDLFTMQNRDTIDMQVKFKNYASILFRVESALTLFNDTLSAVIGNLVEQQKGGK